MAFIKTGVEQSPRIMAQYLLETFNNILLIFSELFSKPGAGETSRNAINLFETIPIGINCS